MRWIAHFDADAFYAAVEQRDQPRLRGKPVAVGHGSGRGVVMTASYEARSFGVRSAMPAGEALRRCPDLIFVPPRMDAYREASRAIFSIYRRYTNLVEPLALDEAYLDLSHVTEGGSSALDVAARIRSEVRHETALAVSAGVSYAKFLAKLASDEGKPDGLIEISHEAAPGYLASLPVIRLHGVGPRTAQRLQDAGLETAGQIAEQPEFRMHELLGKLGRDLWHLTHGVDDRPVDPDRVRKSVSSEETFADDKVGLMPLLAALGPICDSTAVRAKRAGVRGTIVVVKIKDASHAVRTRQRRLLNPTSDAAVLREVAAQLLATRIPLEKPVRLLGVGLAGLTEEDVEQRLLFESSAHDPN